jgi:hypothetical protein
VLLWVQNSHPTPVPAGSVGMNLMGDSDIAWLDRDIPPFGTLAIDTAELLPAARGELIKIALASMRRPLLSIPVLGFPPGRNAPSAGLPFAV